MEDQRPVEFKPGSLGPALPHQALVLSPQHRVLMVDAGGRQVLAPAIGLAERKFVRIKRGIKSVTYHHILLPGHEVVFANCVATESLFPGDQTIKALPVRHKLAILAQFPRRDALPERARRCLSVNETRRARESALRPAGFVAAMHPTELVAG